MNDFFTQLKNATTEITLSTNERERLRDRLTRYSDFVRIREEVTPAREPFLAHVSRLVHRRFVPSALVALVLVATSGVSWAAEGAVPGDPLYSVKVNLNEELVEALSFGGASRLSWEVARAERRLAEAATLASRGALDPTRGAELAERLEQHVLSVTQQAHDLRAENGIAVLDASSELQNALDAHEAILVSLAVSDEAGAKEAEEFAGVVRKSAQELAQVRAGAETTFAAAEARAGTSSPATMAATGSTTGATTTARAVTDAGSSTPQLSEEERRELAAHMRTRAREAQRTAENRLRRASLIDSAYDREASEARLAEIDTLIEAGGAAYTQGDHWASYESYKTAHALAERLTAFLDARLSYRVDPLEVDLGADLAQAGATGSATSTETLALLEERLAALAASTTRLAAGPTRERIEASLTRARGLLTRGTVAARGGDSADATRYASAAELILEATTGLIAGAPPAAAPVTSSSATTTPATTTPATSSTPATPATPTTPGAIPGAAPGESSSTAAPEPTAATPPAPLILSRSQQDGVHTVAGVYPAGRSCEELRATLAPAPGGLTLELTRTELPDVPCAASDAVPFSASAQVPSTTPLLSVTLDGEPISFTRATNTGMVATTGSAASVHYRRVSELLEAFLDSVVTQGR
ncbi:hypothetical protein GVX82_02570 [Patescibacteria group bacterium]|jgi:hypothetical protein|nr:hypothetical protein [Patescibacteria group bacterium]